MKRKIDMTEGNIIKNMFIFSLPLIFTGILQCLFNAADLVVAGRYAGKTALAAVGNTGSFTNLLINLATGLSIGSGVVSSVCFGAKDMENSKKSVGTSVTVGLICGILCMIAGLLITDKVLYILKTPDDIINLSSSYLKIYFIGAPALVLYNFAASLLRSGGETAKPLIYLVITGILNVILNVLFVTQFNMSVFGVGLATTISQYVALGLIIIELIKTDREYKLFPEYLKIDGKIFKKFLLTGIPAAIQGAVFSVSNMLIQSSVNSFGSNAIAGNSAAASIEGFVYVAMNAVGNAATTFTGQNYGAKNFERIKKVYINSAIFVTFVGVLLSAIVILFIRPLVEIYCPSPAEAIQYGVIRSYLTIVPYFLCGLMEVASGILRGTEHAFVAMISSILGACIFRVIWIYTVVAKVRTFESIYISYPISWALVTAAHLAAFLILRKKIKEKCLSAAQVL